MSRYYDQQERDREIDRLEHILAQSIARQAKASNEAHELGVGRPSDTPATDAEMRQWMAEYDARKAAGK